MNDNLTGVYLDIPNDIILKSFKSCGITNDVTGTEDTLITCFQPGHSCEEGLKMLKDQQEQLDEILLLDEADEAEDFHNIDELDLDSTDNEEIDLV